MRSRGSRTGLERGLRAGSFALLAFCAWAMATGGQAGRRAGGQQDQIQAQLVDWTRRAPADTLALALATAPTSIERDWLKALDDAGTRVTWSGSIPATAIDVLPIPDPAGGFTVLAAAPSGELRLADSLGIVDSAAAGRAGAVFRIAAWTGELRATAGRQSASASRPDTLVPRHAVVLGRAGWETRFVMSALEERGWVVDARLSVAPGIAVTQGAPLPLDTARQAVVVAIDSLTPPEAAAVARFVQSGGGVVLSPSAAGALGILAVGQVAPHVRPAVLTFTALNPRASLAMDPVVPRSDAIVLERQRGHVVLAARRAGAGRVLQTGYGETWRWRLGGDADAYREWWAGVVAAASYRSVPGVSNQRGGRRAAGEGGRREAGVSSGREVGDRAPLASLVAALGPATPLTTAPGSLPDPRALLPAAALLLFGSLLAEWLSRRLRGAA